MSTPAEGGRRRRSTLPAVVAAVLACLLGIGPAATPSTAATAPSAPLVTGQAADDLVTDDETRLVIARLTSVVGPGAVPDGVEPPATALIRVLVEHRGDEPLEDAEVVVETFSRVVTRTALHLALDDGEVGNPRVVERHPVRSGTVEPGDIAAVDVFLDVDRLTQADRTGVYPIQVSLARGTTILDRTVTAIVHLDEAPDNPLDTVVVWPVDVEPQTTPDADQAAFDRQVARGGRLDALVAGLEAAPSSGIVPAVSASLLDALIRRSAQAPAEALADDDLDPAQLRDRRAAEAALDLLARIRKVLGSLTHPPVATALADADLVALLDGGPDLARLAGELAADGPRRVEGLAGREPDPAAWLASAPMDGRALDLVPASHLLLPWEAVDGPSLVGNPDVPFAVRRLRSASGRVLTASVADPWLTLAVDDPPTRHGAVVGVQRVLAETALVQFEAPGIADRPLLLLPSRDWTPGGSVARLLSPALANAPWLDLAPAGGHAATPGFLEESTLVPGEHLPEDLVRSIAQGRAELSGIRDSLPEGVTTVAGRPLVELDEQLRRAASHWFVADPDEARATVADVRETIDRAYGTVEVPTADAVTLLSEQGKIPVTIRRPTGDAIEVEVEVRSRGSLAWPNGSIQRRRLQPGETRTLSFDVEARSRGDIPMEIVVRDLSGQRVLADATIRIRSTFVSGPALAITGGVVVLLLLVGRLRRGPKADDDPDPEAPGLQVVGSEAIAGPTKDDGPGGVA